MRISVTIISTLLFACTLTIASSAQTPSKSATTVTPAQEEFFEKRIRPVLAENCYSCHGPKKQRGGLRLDSRIALLKGMDAGVVVVPGDMEKSRLLRAVRYQGELKMPPRNKLPPAAIADLTAWVKMGAPWPGAAKIVGEKKTDDPRSHWAFQPVMKPNLPTVKDKAWGRSPIDRFILARLEEKKLSPSPDADRHTLIRRAYFDLIGLPPTAKEVDDFSADKSPDAFANVIERLLSSPHYGERWGRHWLDIARYADTKGYVFQEERRFPFSYTYRDYVIRSFNEDKPYDRFILEQLAADRLILEKNNTDARSQAAMGFLTLGRRFLNDKHDIIDDRIDVVARGFLGLTVACARCHDHKYDPIPTEDYYSLYGVFASSVEPRELPAIGESARTPGYVAYQETLQSHKSAVEQFKEKHRSELAKRNRKFRDQLRALEKKVARLQATSKFAPPRAMVLVDSRRMFDPYVFKRGKADNHGPRVPRRFLQILSGKEQKPFTQGSGRLELARAIADKNNPLTARVMVNRIWLNHFGQGLVTTPSDFGVRGDPPSHPLLLDYLAAYFVDNAWSIKQMHRHIMLSRAYQQASANPKSAIQNPQSIDPENRLLWKMNRRRLDFEAMRDAMLLVAGNLDRKMGGRSVDITKTPYSGRRTVYAFIDRQNLPGLFRTFDFASPDSSTPQRHQTSVPQQSLFLLNSAFVQEQARAVIRHLKFGADVPVNEKIRRLYRRLLSRNPGTEEIKFGVSFVTKSTNADYQRRSAMNSLEQYAQALLLTNEFHFVD